ncbi:MAG: hypothetical protein ACFFCS_00745 [Candidatus Hodarchaeota archaeon]
MKKDSNYYGNKISTVVFSPLEKNVTFLSQQVELLRFMKNLSQNEEILKPINREIELARKKLADSKRRMIDANRSEPVHIIYDSREGEKLYKKYLQESDIKIKTEEGKDFKIVEAVAEEMANENLGRIHLVTVANRLNLPLDIAKLYLKRSEKGTLVGDMQDLKSIEFVTDRTQLIKDPAIETVSDELIDNLNKLEKFLKEKNIEEFMKSIQYYSDKISFLESDKDFSHKKISLKKISFPLTKLLSLSGFLLDMNSHPDDWEGMEDKVMKDIHLSFQELKAALKNF